MKKTLQILNCIALVTIAACCAVWADEPKEQDMALDKLPAPVQKTIKELVGKGKITNTSRETDKGDAVIYEVAYVMDGKNFEAEISGDGKVIVVDEQIEMNDAPEPVQKTFKEKIGDGEIVKIEKATEGKEIYYEVEFKKDGKEHEVKVSPDGKVMAEE